MTMFPIIGGKVAWRARYARNRRHLRPSFFIDIEMNANCSPLAANRAEILSPALYTDVAESAPTFASSAKQTG